MEAVNNTVANLARNRYGNDMAAELGDAVTETAESINGGRRDIDAYELLGGRSVSSKVRVVIARDNTAQGWHVLTSFPVR